MEINNVVKEMNEFKKNKQVHYILLYEMKNRKK